MNKEKEKLQKERDEAHSALESINGIIQERAELGVVVGLLGTENSELKERVEEQSSEMRHDCDEFNELKVKADQLEREVESQAEWRRENKKIWDAKYLEEVKEKAEKKKLLDENKKMHEEIKKMRAENATLRAKYILDENRDLRAKLERTQSDVLLEDNRNMRAELANLRGELERSRRTSDDYGIRAELRDIRAELASIKRASVPSTRAPQPYGGGEEHGLYLLCVCVCVCVCVYLFLFSEMKARRLRSFLASRRQNTRRRQRDSCLQRDSLSTNRVVHPPGQERALLLRQ
ncbi:hypothetical protein FACS189472_18510 [Alphaproteobacteria bacterium]|nr:hypothetical protein FACS189472_18510 [Alphaproteobacteria bacterium]